MNSIYFLSIFFIGLCFGSFLNACIYRFRHQISFKKQRSFCPACRHTLSVKDLVPLLSFFFLKGKCRYCGQRISWQYLVMELVTGLLFIIVYAKFLAFNLSFFVLIIFTLILLFIFVYDLKYFLILDEVSLPAIILSLALNWLLYGSQMNLQSFAVSYGFGILIGGLFFLGQFLLTKGKGVGGGDVRLGMLLGAMLGFKLLICALALGYVFGAVFSVFYVVFFKGGLKSKIPLAPFLTLAAFIVLLQADKFLIYFDRFFYLSHL